VVRTTGSKEEDGALQPVSHGPKVARELKSCGPWKGPDFKASITVFKEYCQSYVGGQQVVNPQSLTRTAVARGPSWLGSFGPALLRGGTILI